MFNIFKMFGGLVAGNFVARILLSLGVSFVTFAGLDAILSSATSSIRGLLSGLPGVTASLLGLGDVDFAINLILSAYSARLAMFAVRQMRLLS